jgi:Transglycosylase SLT domain
MGIPAAIRTHWLAGFATICASIMPARAVLAPPAEAVVDCRGAAGMAEREAGLPTGLLLAIGKIESGRANPATGEIDPWPFTTNLRGAGRVFASSQEAVAWVEAQQAVGSRAIDVGCFQVDLQFHPSAFATLQEAFDPLSNARYAARFLTELHARTGSWPEAVALYHSAEPSLGLFYRSQVFAAWGSGGAGFDRPPVAKIAFADRVTVRLSARAAAVRIELPQWANAGGRAPQLTRRPGLPPVFTPSR